MKDLLKKRWNHKFKINRVGNLELLFFAAKGRKLESEKWMDKKFIETFFNVITCLWY